MGKTVSLLNVDSRTVSSAYVDIEDVRHLDVDTTGVTVTDAYADTLTTTGDILVVTGIDDQGRLDLDSNRAAANNVVGSVRGFWDGNQAARMFFFSGNDTVNKDEGYIRFDVFSGGAAQTGLLQIGSATTVDTTFNVNGYNSDVTINAQTSGVTAHFDASASAVGINKTGPTDTLDVNGGIVGNYVNFVAVAAASVPNGSIFLDSADGNIKCKGSAGTLTTIGPA